MRRGDVWLVLFEGERRHLNTIDAVKMADVLLEHYDMRFARDPVVDVTTVKAMQRGMKALDIDEMRRILKVLEDAGGNKAAASKQLGIHRRSMYRYLKRIEDHGSAV